MGESDAARGRDGAIAVVAGWRPGALGDVAMLHGRYYGGVWGFGPYFEAKVATDLAAFLSRPASEDAELWRALDPAGRAVGSIAIDGVAGDGRTAACGAQLRWFILDASARGTGVGRRLLDGALAFCRERSFPSVHLWTFAGLDDARRMYERRGFRLVEERRAATWGKEALDQRFVLDLRGGRGPG